MLSEEELNILAINRIKEKPAEVNSNMTKALKNKHAKFFNEVIKKMTSGPFESRLKVK